MRQSEQGRAWFGRALHDFLWSDGMNELLEEMEAGWLNGGCRTCAASLFRWMTLMTLSSIPRLVNVNQVVVACQDRPADHAVAYVQLEGCDWYIDANGVRSRGQLLRYWEQGERLRSPRLAEYDSVLLESVGIPYHAQISEHLTTLLVKRFGFFSSEWLQRP